MPILIDYKCSFREGWYKSVDVYERTDDLSLHPPRSAMQAAAKKEKEQSRVGRL